MTPRVMSTGPHDVSSDAPSDRSYPRSALGLTVLGLAILAAMVVGLTGPSAAQRYDGTNTSPSVTVDLSVLDDLGRAPNVPQLILRNPTGSAYVNNPYRSGPKFPVISNPTSRYRNQRVVLRPPPPTITKRRVTRKLPKKTARRAPPPARKKVVRRTPLKKRTSVASAPRKPAASPPPPAMDKPPAAVVPPPPRIAAVNPREIETPPPASAVREPQNAPEPPPLPPVTTAPKPKEVARSYALPPPAPPKANTRPERETRRKVTSRSSTAEPAPAKKPVRTAPSPSTEVASLPRATLPVRSGSLRRIEFPRGSAKLSDKASLGLKNVASAMSRDPALRIQLLAYAGQLSDSASQARRLSLSRALAARSKLIEQGVRSTRIDVRALGNKSAGGPADRIDIIVTKR